MRIILELFTILTVCMAGECIAVLLPFTFPASVISLILLIVLLLTGVIKEGYIKHVADFIMRYMSFFFMPSCIGVMQYFDLIGPQLLPFLLITALTTPLIYFTTAWTVQLMVRRGKKEDAVHD